MRVPDATAATVYNDNVQKLALFILVLLLYWIKQ